ncbi:2-oxoglutarate dehydrogenase complex dihydrolipoyllysine-residue succinyltransferase [Acanthopleuribacter pedis]|uniref:Dihydrolipoyllysine-residue succinyltransferase component of 2-oxoglutarate dehydrogenase complex n=1 Tax=Acanthopleuribacter pedis TaxID=442870 RepID=A0A8J7U108_9BACT|nr:2-oxoglutarate dehydrogenase complex dihydrolipoyllysine-residue succinyltransferase [Acanthopleuribacter pedis]MBO1317658.1 2-oxoglutarate dehydrogenase complex dihydrolipoyllysine-residue succinyltransferase [Acanthopleuribacter pedis]
MKIEIKVPQAGESVTEAMISEWFKENGDTVDKDEAVLELETDKANMELNADQAGTVEILVEAGEVVTVGQIIGYIDTEGAGANSADPAPAAEEAPAEEASGEEKPLSPAVRRIVAEEKLDPNTIDGSGKDGRILKGDALKAAQAKSEPAPEPAAPAPKKAANPAPKKAAPAPAPTPVKRDGSRGETTKPMSMMRRRIAERLVQAQHESAILTTFNEVDMSAVMAMRSKYKEAFEKRHGVRLGFMSFFVKACVEALRFVPEINASIDGTNIIYRDYQDIGVAVGTKKGLLVPIIRNAGDLTMAGVEAAINDYAVKARDGKISLDDLAGGTFTISNGGVYGSLLSTPILNPPQSGILGMHKIEKRPVVIDDEIVIRPMMYLALSYDHRIVDGKGAVTFLVKVKEALEDPARMLLEV